MKFLAIAAIATVSACPEGECYVTDSESGEQTCTAQADVDASEGAMVCDPDSEMPMEEEGSNTLFASVATVAVATTLMY